MTEGFTLLTALLAGLLGSLHCMAMCGGISSTLALAAEPATRLRMPWLYNLGRLASYTLFGLLAGGLGLMIDQFVPQSDSGFGLRNLTGVMMLLIGAWLAFQLSWLEFITRYGQHVWGKIAPMAGRFMPLRTASDALALGFLWGWLPCGLVYAMLLTAWLTASPLQGAAVMLAFGLGTLPAMVGMGLAAGWVSQHISRERLRRWAGISLMLFGLWTLAGPWLIHELNLPVPEGLAGCKHPPDPAGH